MAATDVAPHRLAAAKKAALRQLAAEKDDAPGIVLAFSSDVEVLQTLTTDRDLLRRAVEGVSQTQRPTRLEPALELIGALTGPHPVHLFSDGGFPDVGDLDFDPPALRYHRIGEAEGQADNVGLVTLNAVRDERDPSRLLVFAQVANFRATEAAVRLELDVTVDGKPKKVYAPERNDGKDGTDAEAAHHPGSQAGPDR